MQAPKSLLKPQNWQDFETLCKKLWGEIWECREIKKNGRQGQAQNGVDVYGIPKGGKGYYGIQCKGKDAYNGKNLTRKEIDIEIEKAKEFTPKLEKLYFVTTADKDVKIEEYIRIVNLENISKGLFEVHLYCWGDITELIFENSDTYNFYVQNLNLKEKFSGEFKFSNGSISFDYSPKFRKDTIVKVQKIPERYNPRAGNDLDLLGASFGYTNTEKLNLSLNLVQLKLKNTGKSDITNFKFTLKFEGDVDDLILNSKKYNFIISPSTLHINKSEKLIEVFPNKKILVGDEEYILEEFYVKTPPTKSLLKLHWKLLSSNFKDSGTLLLNINPEIIEKELRSETENYFDVGKVVVRQIEDYWEYIKV
jgi:hypothetical protein